MTTYHCNTNKNYHNNRNKHYNHNLTSIRQCNTKENLMITFWGGENE